MCLNNIVIKLVLIISFLYLLNSCNPKDELNIEKEFTETPSVSENVIEVMIDTAKVGAFHNKINGVGKIVFTDDVQLSWPIGGLIKDIYVDEGQSVQKGSLIAEVDSEALKSDINLALLALEKAKLKREDMLISAGINDSSSTVDSIRRHVIDINSGFEEAILNLSNLKIELAKSNIYSPINGIIHQLEAHRGEWAREGQSWTKVLSTHSSVMDFQLLESEAVSLKPKQQIRYRSFANEQIKGIGTIKSIFPRVSSEGLVNIRAQVNEPKLFRLMDGMKMEVEVLSRGVNALLIPKSAVLIRSGKAVVFVYVSGLAKWHYVTLGDQNDTHYVVTEGLESGDLVIVQGHLNLSHDAPVKLIQYNN